MAKKYYTDLELRGNQLKGFVIQHLASAPANPKKGMGYFDTVQNKFGWWDGTNWIYLGDTAAVEQAISELQSELESELAGKVDVVAGKGLSTEDFTTALKEKLENLGTMANEDKDDYYTKQNIVDKFWSNNDKTLATGHFRTDTQGPNGTAILWNEEDGGGSKFEHSDGTWSYIGTNDGGANGLAGQLYAVEKIGNKYSGTKLDIKKSGMYYTTGAASEASLADRDVPANELAVKGDITSAVTSVQNAIEAEAQARITNDNKKVDKELEGANGTAIIFNETDGGGAKFENKDGTESFIGVHDGSIGSGDNKLVAQIYADKQVGGKWQGAKIDITNGGMYYTVGDKSFDQRAVADNEIAVKGDLSALEASIDQKLTSVYKFKGSVNAYNDLPDQDLTEGDVYNIATADSTHGIKAGDNVAWVAPKNDNPGYWDILAGITDLSAYAVKADVDNELDSINAAIETLSNGSVHKEVVTCGELEDTNNVGYVTWEIHHTLNTPNVHATVIEVESGDEVEVDKTYSSGVVTIKMNVDEDEVIQAGAFKAIIIG